MKAICSIDFFPSPPPYALTPLAFASPPFDTPPSVSLPSHLHPLPLFSPFLIFLLFLFHSFPFLLLFLLPLSHHYKKLGQAIMYLRNFQELQSGSWRYTGANVSFPAGSNLSAKALNFRNPKIQVVRATQRVHA